MMIYLCQMDRKVVSFLDKHRISVLTTILPDGTPHSASLHYANSVDPLYFIFWTGRKTRKCAHFEEGKKYPSSLAIGFSEEEFVTIQMEGQISIVSKKDIDSSYKVYQAKFEGSAKYNGDKDDVLLKFVPKWWRYSEFKPKLSTIESK